MPPQIAKREEEKVENPFLYTDFSATSGSLPEVYVVPRYSNVCGWFNDTPYALDMGVRCNLSDATGQITELSHLEDMVEKYQTFARLIGNAFPINEEHEKMVFKLSENHDPNKFSRLFPKEADL